MAANGRAGSPAPSLSDTLEAASAGMHAPRSTSGLLRTCYECFTVNQRSVRYETLEKAYADTSDTVIRDSCHLIENENCPDSSYSPCVMTTVCGEDPHSKAGGCIFGFCTDCHLYATCIDSDGKLRCDRYRACEPSWCTEPDPGFCE